MTEELHLLSHRMKQGNFFCVLHLHMNVTVELIYCNICIFSHD